MQRFWGRGMGVRFEGVVIEVRMAAAARVDNLARSQDGAAAILVVAISGSSSWQLLAHTFG
jgi:hypothetical protein